MGAISKAKSTAAMSYLRTLMAAIEGSRRLHHAMGWIITTRAPLQKSMWGHSRTNEGQQRSMDAAEDMELLQAGVEPFWLVIRSCKTWMAAAFLAGHSWYSKVGIVAESRSIMEGKRQVHGAKVMAVLDGRHAAAFFGQHYFFPSLSSNLIHHCHYNPLP